MQGFLSNLQGFLSNFQGFLSNLQGFLSTQLFSFHTQTYWTLTRSSRMASPAHPMTRWPRWPDTSVTCDRSPYCPLARAVGVDEHFSRKRFTLDGFQRTTVLRNLQFGLELFPKRIILEAKTVWNSENYVYLLKL